MRGAMMPSLFLITILASAAIGQERPPTTTPCGPSELPCPAGCWDASRAGTAIATRLCEPVGLGYYSSIFDDDRYPCPAGSSSNNSTTARLCPLCLAGTYSSVSLAICMDCPSGSFAALDGAEFCDSCDPRYYNGSGSGSMVGVSSTGVPFCKDPTPEAIPTRTPVFLSPSSFTSMHPTMASQAPSAQNLPTGSPLPANDSMQPGGYPSDAQSSFPSPYPRILDTNVPSPNKEFPDLTGSENPTAMPTLGLDENPFLYGLPVQNMFAAGVILTIFLCMIVLVCCCNPTPSSRGGGRRRRQTPSTSLPSRLSDASAQSTYFDGEDKEQDTNSVGTLEDMSMLDHSPAYLEELERATGLAFGLDENELRQAKEDEHEDPDDSIADASLWNFSVAGATFQVDDHHDDDDENSNLCIIGAGEVDSIL